MQVTRTAMFYVVAFAAIGVCFHSDMTLLGKVAAAAVIGLVMVL